jgi:hypothetical protein
MPLLRFSNRRGYAVKGLCPRRDKWPFCSSRFIEQWGSGINRMIIACREAGLDESVLQRSRHSFSGDVRQESRWQAITSRSDRPSRCNHAFPGKGLSTAELAVRIYHDVTLADMV